MNKITTHAGFLTVTKLLSFILLWGSLASCEKNEEANPQASGINNAQVSVQNLTDYLVKTTGFDASLIVYQPESKNFIINNDILIQESDVLERIADSSEAKTEQWRWNYLVKGTYVTNIDYYIQTNVPAAWKTATRESIKNWNAINGTRLFLRETTNQSSADVVVKMGYENANWVARAYLPSYSGRAGFEVTINSKYNSLSASYKEFTMTHEMGHNFGLAHTDQNSGIFIKGTPTRDAKSVMNSVVLPWTAFTAGDIKAIQTIYPQ